jgi:hypothetical protein
MIRAFERDALVRFSEFSMAIARLVSCLHNRDRLDGTTVALSIVLMIESPGAAETPRAQALRPIREFNTSWRGRH